MNLTHGIPAKLSLLKQTLYFLKKHVLVITTLGLVAAAGRVIQLGGFGPVTGPAHVLLEIVVEVARVLLFLYVLGLASFQKGLFRIRRFFTDPTSRKLYWATALQSVKRTWGEILLNLLAFAGLAWFINYLIDLLAYQTCLYLTLKQHEIISPAASEWTIILFFKNLSVIPFTLTFEALFLLWIINRVRSSPARMAH